MALKLSVKFKEANAEYFRINEFIYNDVKDEAVVKVNLYVDNKASDLSLVNNSLEQKVFILKGIKLIKIPEGLKVDNPRDLLKAMLYGRLKMLPEFKDAQDC